MSQPKPPRGAVNPPRRSFRARLGALAAALAALAGAAAVPAPTWAAPSSPPAVQRGSGVLTPTRVDVRAAAGAPGPAHRTVKPFFTPDPAKLASEKASGRGTKPNRMLEPRAAAGSEAPGPGLPFAGPYFGLSHDFQLGFEGDIEPPDTQLAVGPDFMLEMVNSAFLIMDKAGNPVVAGSLEAFFDFSHLAHPGEVATDPRVHFDPSSGRFFASVLGFSLDQLGRPASGTVMVAVSSDSNPLHSWAVYAPYRKTGALCDQPVLGISGDKVSFACNEFVTAGFFNGDFLYVLNKSQMLAGTALNFAFASSLGWFSLTPVLTLNPNGPLPNATIAVYNRRPIAGVGEVGVVAVTGVPGAGGATLVPEVDLPIAQTSVPPDAEQPGAGAQLIATNDDRFLGAVWQGGRLWVGGNQSCLIGVPVACLKLVQLDTSGWDPGVSGAPAVAQDLGVAAAGLHVYFPAVMVDAGGDLYTVFSESSAAVPVSVAGFYTAQCGAANGQLELSLFIQGVGTYASPGRGPVARWGDYSGAARDPIEPNRVWLTGEYTAGSGTRQWGTGTVEAPVNTFADSGRPYTGGHDAIGAAAGSTDWFFAEGYTGPNFDEFLTVQNPGAAQPLCVDYLLENGGVISRSYNLAGSSRTTIRVNDEIGFNLPVSMRLHAANPVVAERPMYFLYSGAGGVTGGHDVMGATSLGSMFYFAEGYTGPGFDEFLTLMNVDPSTTSSVDVTYFFSNGTSKTVNHPVAPQSRLTVYVNGAAEAGPNQEVSTLVQVASGPNILAERPMYFNYQGTWTGGHVVIGARAPTSHVDLAEGYVASNFHQWLTILNPGGSDAHLTITYNLGGGGQVVKTMTVAAHSRATRLVNGDLPAGTPNSVHVDSDQPVVVERPMYFDYSGNVANITGGHDAVAVDSSTLGTSYSFAEGFVASNFDEYLTVQNNNGGPVTITVTYFLAGGGPPVVKPAVIIPAHSRYTRLVNADFAVPTPHSVQVTSSGGPVLVERPMYFAF